MENFLDEAPIQNLRQLGLTRQQARIFLTLLRGGAESSANSLAKSCNIARQDVYRILSDLHEKDLIEKVIGTPSRFKAIPPEKAIDILLKRKTQEIAGLKSKKGKILKNFVRETKGIQDSTPQFIIPSRELVMIRTKKKLREVKTSMDVMTVIERVWDVFASFSKDYDNAVSRGVKIRYLIEKPADVTLIPRLLGLVHKHPLFEIKFTSRDVPTPFGITDNQEVSIVTSTTTRKMTGAQLLQTNCPAIVELFRDYFELKWQDAFSEDLKTQLNLIQLL